MFQELYLWVCTGCNGTDRRTDRRTDRQTEGHTDRQNLQRQRGERGRKEWNVWGVTRQTDRQRDRHKEGRKEGYNTETQKDRETDKERTMRNKELRLTSFLCLCNNGNTGRYRDPAVCTGCNRSTVSTLDRSITWT